MGILILQQLLSSVLNLAGGVYEAYSYTRYALASAYEAESSFWLEKLVLASTPAGAGELAKRVSMADWCGAEEGQGADGGIPLEGQEMTGSLITGLVAKMIRLCLCSRASKF